MRRFWLYFPNHCLHCWDFEYKKTDVITVGSIGIFTTENKYSALYLESKAGALNYFVFLYCLLYNNRNITGNLTENYNIMKKLNKINLLHNSIDTYQICRCHFKYDLSYWYFYILDHSDKLFLGVEEDDFMLDGFQIRKISDLTKIEIKNDLCAKINEETNILVNICKPGVNISSWKTVFESLKALNNFIIIENEKLGDDSFFYMGKIAKIKKTCVIFSHVDADGEWYDNIEIPYSKVTSVTFNDRYSKTWQKYLSK